MKKTLLRTTMVCAIICYAFTSKALDIPPKGGNPGGGGHHDAPFDGGASLLLAAGAVYGIKKAYNRRKQENA
jgi:hypothetical protein